MLNEFQKLINSTQLTIKKLGEELINYQENTLNILINKDINKFKSLKDIKNINTKANKIDNDIIKMFALYQPEADILRDLISMLKINDEIFKIYKNIRSYTKTLKEEFEFYKNKKNLINMHKISLEALKISFNNNYQVMTQKSKEINEKAKKDYPLLQKEILTALKNNKINIKNIKIVNNIEELKKILEHTQNISELISFVKKGGKFKVRI